MIRSLTKPFGVAFAVALLSGCATPPSGSATTGPNAAEAATTSPQTQPAAGSSAQSDGQGQQVDCSISIPVDFDGPIPRDGCNPLNMTPVKLKDLTAQPFATVQDLASAAQSAGWSCGSYAPMGMGRGKMECEPEFGTINYNFFVLEDPAYPSEFANKVESILSTPAPADRALYVVIGPNWIISGLFGSNIIPTLTPELQLGGQVRKVPTEPYSSRQTPPA